MEEKSDPVSQAAPACAIEGVGDGRGEVMRFEVLGGKTES